MTSTLKVLARGVRALIWLPRESGSLARWRRAGRPVVLVTSAVLATIGTTSCAERPTALRQPSRIATPDRSGATDASPTASVRWNSVALGLVDTYRPKLGQQAALRAMAYLSLAQYNAEVTAEAADTNPSPRAAVAGASAVVLTYVFPDAAVFLEAKVRE
ncbi:MAG TPA: hypothetical protein VHE78_16405, partial [Gemmatimonadaceae bacterium]|nr:hypothetical protein [Gemmatimonadaceae bacterium]